MNLIVNVDLDWGIGFNESLLERIPDDMKFFRKTTIGKVVILGRKTLASFPSGRPLKDRTNIILTTDTSFKCDEAIICNSIEDLFNKILEYNSEDIFVIGGDTVYRQLLPYCSKAYVTKYYKHHSANKFFPNLDSDSDWILTEIGPIQFFNEIQFNFNTYENRNPKESSACQCSSCHLK